MELEADPLLTVSIKEECEEEVNMEVELDPWCTQSSSPRGKLKIHMFPIKCSKKYTIKEAISIFFSLFFLEGGEWEYIINSIYTSCFTSRVRKENIKPDVSL